MVATEEMLDEEFTSEGRSALDRVIELSARAHGLDEFLSGFIAALRGCACGCGEVAVLLREGSHLRLHASSAPGASCRIRVGEGIEGLAVSRRETVRGHGDGTAKMAVPLVAGGEVVGVVRLTLTAEPTDAAARCFNTLIERAAAPIALHAERLDSARRARMGAAVSTLGHAALTSPTLDALLAHAIDAIAGAIDAPYVAVVERVTNGLLAMRAVQGWPQEAVGYPFTREEDRVQVTYTLATDATVYAPNLLQEKRFDASMPLAVAPVRSAVSLPIRLGTEAPYGVLIVHATEEEVFTEDRVAFIEAIANVLGATIARDRETARLREREAFLRLATDAASLGTWDWSPLDHRLAWSPRTFEIFGIPDDGALSYVRYLACIPSEDHPAQQAAIAAALDPKGPRRFRVEHRIHREVDGAERWVVGHGIALFDGDDRPVRLLGTTMDVTEQVLARKEAESVQAALKAAVRAKDEFLAMLGHELRNPLAPIVTALRLMQLRGASNSPERDVIERQVRHLTRLVDDLLDVSRIAAGRVHIEFETLDVADVVTRALELASHLVETRSHRLDVSLPTSPLRVRGDAVRLAQVVCNLLANAAKYTPERGRIELRVAREDGAVVLRVRDDGIGIAPELLPRVFDLFTQGQQSIERAQGGMGLGLAIVRSLVALHGGTVEAHSEGEGRGSEFVVRLDAVDLPPPPRESLTPPRGGIRPGVRVLLADDNADSLGVLALALEAEGCEVVAALDGPTALARAEDLRPEVAVIDIGLPVMDGYELARSLRTRWRGLPLVALTGYSEPGDHARSKAAGFAVHLVKPVNFERLLGVLGELVGPAGGAPV